MSLRARIAIQAPIPGRRGRVYLTIFDDDREMLLEEVSCKAVAELRINALQEAECKYIPVEVETGL